MQRFKEILSRKIAGVPVAVIMLLGVLGLAYYLKKRQDAAAATNPGASVAGAGQTFPNGNPMSYSTDVFINNQNPVGRGPRVVIIPAGTQNLYDWVARQHAIDPTFTWEKMMKLNPGLAAKILWKDPGPGGATEPGTNTPVYTPWTNSDLPVRVR